MVRYRGMARMTARPSGAGPAAVTFVLVTDMSAATAAHAPRADRRPAEWKFHNDLRTDEYAWLADREDPATIEYLTAENAYTEAATAHLSGLRETLFTEIKTRTQETDLSLPVRHHGFWYYTRTEEGQQYGIHCRVPAEPGNDTPPSTAEGTPLPGEEVLLDGNAEAAGHDFFSLGTFDVSPDGNWLAYSTDYSGDERYTLRVRNLLTGDVLPDEIVEVGHGSAWSADASVLFYIRVDEAWRPHQIWRHVIGSPVRSDQLVYEDPDERFFVGIELSRSERFLLLGSSSKITSEYRFVPADTPLAEPTLVAGRREGVEYEVAHQGDRFVILHNDGALDFELATAPIETPGQWTTLIPHEAGRRLTSVDAFAGHLVVSLRRDGLTGLRVLPMGGGAAAGTATVGAGTAAGEHFDIAFPEPIYTVGVDSTPEYDTGSVRIEYTSLVTPDSIYDCDLATGALTLRKIRPVRPDTHGRPYTPEDYEQHREWAVAEDGTRIPISVVCKAGTPRDGSAPLVLYGYGSYEYAIDPYFSIPRLSLLDRGVVFAIAHIRGGGEMGRRWYDDGKLLAKRNTFTDFIAASRHLAATGWTTTGKTIARGGSAGGLLVGASVTIAPDAFGGVVAVVPFVDALTTILDPSMPLTVTEWEEWGNPIDDPDVYAYMKSYSPYENVSEHRYPPLLVLGSLNDTRVSYAEPTKWVARIRERSPETSVLLKTEMGAGHGGPSGRYNSWREEAFVMSWILDQVGLA
jgi:oligopeptidase B